jgi:hypothetical protein
MLALVLPKPISSVSVSCLVVLDAVLEKEEEKNRFRAKVLQQGMSNDDVSPRNMTLFLQQVSGEEVPTQGIYSLYIACKHKHVL